MTVVIGQTVQAWTREQGRHSMGEIIDLESYRRQRKRRPSESGTADTRNADTGTIETESAETGTAANRRRRNRGRSERDRLRSVIDPPAVEILDRGRGSVDPAANAKPGDESAD